MQEYFDTSETSGKMAISKAEPNDLPDILSLQKICYHESGERYKDFTISPLVQTLKELQNEFNDSIILKAVFGEKIIGSIRAFEKMGTGYIGRVIVHPQFQNKGIGKVLMMQMERMFPEVNRFELFTGFRDEKNLHFYHSLGYTPCKVEKITDNLFFVFLEKIISK